MSKLVFSPPTPDTPGFFKRQKMVLEFVKKIKGKEMEPDTIDDIIEFLLPYVTEPVDRDEARNTLWEEATEKEYMELLDALRGGGANPTKQTQNQSDTS